MARGPSTQVPDPPAPLPLSFRLKDLVGPVTRVKKKKKKKKVPGPPAPLPPTEHVRLELPQDGVTSDLSFLKSVDVASDEAPPQ